jgi:hypothetical protein
MVESEPNGRYSVCSSGALPYFEYPDAFFSDNGPHQARHL